ncbi:MAG: MoaD/ThiS family protein [Planctomycetota bacterium]
MKVKVVISGRSYETAESVPEHLTLPDACSLDDALRSLAEFLPAGRTLPSSCLVAVSGTHLGTLGNHASRELRDGDELVVIAPVAGG